MQVWNRTCETIILVLRKLPRKSDKDVVVLVDMQVECSVCLLMLKFFRRFIILAKSEG